MNHPYRDRPKKRRSGSPFGRLIRIKIARATPTFILVTILCMCVACVMGIMALERHTLNREKIEGYKSQLSKCKERLSLTFPERECQDTVISTDELVKQGCPYKGNSVVVSVNGNNTWLCICKL